MWFAFIDGFSFRNFLSGDALGGLATGPILSPFDLPAARGADRYTALIHGRASDVPVVADGEVTPEEAGNVMRLIEGVGKAIDTGELHERLRKLEERMPK